MSATVYDFSLIIILQVVFWYRNGVRLLNGQSSNLSVKEEEHNEMSIVSMTTIGQATNSQHTGKYECAPDNSKPAYINLHVITGEYQRP